MSTPDTLEDSEGQGSLACCSPFGHKELDMIERLNNTDHINLCILRNPCVLGINPT